MTGYAAAGEIVAGMEKAETLNHVRRPDLPWRISTTTECGRPVGSVKSHISRDELLTRLQSFGSARTSLTTCMTCWQTASRWKTFDQDPVDALRREVYRTAGDEPLAAELRALAALAVAHQAEFEGFLADLSKTVSMMDRSRRRRGTA